MIRHVVYVAGRAVVVRIRKLGVALLALAAVSSPASTMVWTGNSNVTWALAANWSPSVPGVGDTAEFSGSPVNWPTVTASTNLDGLTLTVAPTITISNLVTLTVSNAAGTTGSAGLSLKGPGFLSWGAAGSNLSFGTSAITLDGGGFRVTGTEIPVAATTGLPTTGGGADRTLLNDIVVTSAGGRLGMNTGSGSSGLAVAFNTLTLGGVLTMSSQGGGNADGYTIAGTVTLQQDTTRTLRFVNDTGHNGNDWIAGKITDGAGGAANPLRIQVTGRALQIANGTSDYAGGTIVEGGSGDYYLDVMAGGRLGSGSLAVQSGARVRLNSATPLGVDGNLAAAVSISCEAGAAVGVGTNLNAASRFTPTSSGIYGIDGAASHSYALDMASLGGGAMYLGSVLGGTYAGTNLQAGTGNVYRLGGGSPGSIMKNLTLTGTNALTGARSMKVGLGLNTSASYGRVLITAPQDFSGLVTIDSDGFLATTMNGGTPFGNTGNPIVCGGTLAAGGTAGVFNDAYLANLSTVPGCLVDCNNENFANAVGYANADRWPDGRGIALNGGAFRLTSARLADVSETIGPVVFSGHSQLQSRRTSNTPGDNVLTVAGVTRTGVSVLDVSVTTAANLGGNTDSNCERFVVSDTSGLQINNGMVAPWAVDTTGTNFLRYDATPGTVPAPTSALGLRPATYFTNSLNAGPAVTDIVSVGATVGLISNVACYALKIAGDYSVTNKGGTTVTLGSGGLIDAGNGTHTVAFDSGSAEAIVWKFAKTSTYNGGIRTTGGLIKAGSAQMTLGGSPVISGGVTIQQGTLQISSSNAAADLADNLLTVNQDGRLDILNNDVSVLGLAGLGRSASVINSGTSARTLTLNVVSGAQVYEGGLQTSGTLTNLNLLKSGNGTQVLAGTSRTWVGGTTTVSGGVLLVNGSYSNSPGTVTVNAGAVLGGTGTVYGAVAVNAGGGLAPGSQGIGALTVGSATLAAGSTNTFDLGLTGACDKVVALGTLTVAGKLNVASAVEPGSYIVMTSSGTMTDSGLSLGSMPTGFHGVLSVDTGNRQVRLDLSNSAGFTLQIH